MHRILSEEWIISIECSSMLIIQTQLYLIFLVDFVTSTVRGLFIRAYRYRDRYKKNQQEHQNKIHYTQL